MINISLTSKEEIDIKHTRCMAIIQLKEASLLSFAKANSKEILPICLLKDSNSSFYLFRVFKEWNLENTINHIEGSKSLNGFFNYIESRFNGDPDNKCFQKLINNFEDAVFTLKAQYELCDNQKIQDENIFFEDINSKYLGFVHSEVHHSGD